MEQVGEVDPNEVYQFDTVGLWRHKETGKLYWDSDSGCSCPVPFDNFTPKPLPETWEQFKAEVDANGDTSENRNALLALAQAG
jgi:hypothetical protein